jgi:hypothetical protein
MIRMGDRLRIELPEPELWPRFWPSVNRSIHVNKEKMKEVFVHHDPTVASRDGAKGRQGETWWQRQRRSVSIIVAAASYKQIPISDTEQK